MAAEAGVKTATTVLPLEQAGEALEMLRSGDVEGSLVLTVG